MSGYKFVVIEIVKKLGMVWNEAFLCTLGCQEWSGARNEKFEHLLIL